MKQPLPADFRTAIAPWPAHVQARFAVMRAIVLDTATAVGAAPLNESLKWGQPSWRPKKARTGSTLRLWWEENTPDLLTLYVNCQTTLCTDIDRACPDQFILHGNRGLSHRISTPIPQQAIATCAEMTLTYFRSPLTA